jgi:hypothetical protein
MEELVKTFGKSATYMIVFLALGAVMYFLCAANNDSFFVQEMKTAVTTFFGNMMGIVVGD